MKRRAIQFFRRGRWLHLASQYITNPQRMRELVDTVSQYTHRRGLKKLRDNATQLWQYLSDVVTQRYKHYNNRALLLVVAGLIYLVTPIDFLPDILIGGLIDDLSVVLYIIKSTRKELEFYNLYSKGRLLGQ
jgi:uncharacterized membrane protein YkvA (DUF1232 family)